MSVTTTRRPLSAAVADAKAFKAMFPESCYSTWHVAGSMRRGKLNIGDIEHVIISRTGEVEIGGSLFAEKETKNLLWLRLDELLKHGDVTQHLYGESPRWGEKMRGVDFRGFCHEIWTADEHNFGAKYAIRTGPSGYSRILVTSLFKQGYWQYDGYVVDRRKIDCACGWRGDWMAMKFDHPVAGDRPKYVQGPGAAVLCPKCGYGGGVTIERVSVPDEQTYFHLCGLDYVEPSRRFDPEERR